MKLVFASNFFNHHQKPLSDALSQMEDVEYHFLSFTPIPEERKRMGYEDDRDPSYVIRAYESEDAMERCRKLIADADAVIFGSVPHRYIRHRIWSNKLTLRYSERPLKKGNQLLKYVPRWLLWHIRYPNHKKLYLLCASAYTAGDFAKFGLFRNRSFQWGYFPETKTYASQEKMMFRKKNNQILWCGRFLDLKHPDDAVTVAQKLRENGYDFQLRIIGSGEMEGQLKTAVAEYRLEGYVQFCGTMPPEEVRVQMEESGIFLFTSDRREGWGAVLNESMNSGCAVVASHAIGSVPYLIRDGENGLIYDSGNVDMLYERVKYLLDHPRAQRQLGENAYRTITGMWSAEEASARVVELISKLLAGEDPADLYESGPCSRTAAWK